MLVTEKASERKRRDLPLRVLELVALVLEVDPSRRPPPPAAGAQPQEFAWIQELVDNNNHHKEVFPTKETIRRLKFIQLHKRIKK